jgi:hypothetical protein
MNILSKMAVLGAKIGCSWSKIDCFKAKSSEIGHTKTSLAAKVANFLQNDQVKIIKIAILSSHALYIL